MTRFNSQCVLPCKGVYADISKTNLDGTQQSRTIQKIQNEYEHYKRGFSRDFPIPTEISCKFILSQSFTLLKYLKYLDYRYHTKLRWVRIFFDTASFDKITKDDKAPFDVRLSSVGGTLGLLTGFSLISAMEILFFSSKLIIALLEKMTRKKSYEMKN